MASIKVTYSSRQLVPEKVTLLTYHRFDKQDIFDFVVCNLLKQGIKSIDESIENHGHCKYRLVRKDDRKVLKCAIGQLIPKSLYNPIIEYQGIQAIHRLLNIELDHTKLDLLHSMQNIHDGKEVDQWFDAFVELAKVHRLQVNFNPQGNYLDI